MLLRLWQTVSEERARDGRPHFIIDGSGTGAVPLATLVLLLRRSIWLKADSLRRSASMNQWMSGRGLMRAWEICAGLGIVKCNGLPCHFVGRSC